MRDELAWTTASEMKFLDNIGSFSGKTSNRLILLRLYQKTMKNRVRWGNINPNEIEFHLQKLIMKEEDRVRLPRNSQRQNQS